MIQPQQQDSPPEPRMMVMLRLLGTVVELRQHQEEEKQQQELAPPTAPASNNDDEAITSMDTIVLDDGTGLAHIRTPPAMTAQIHVQIGMTLECVVRVIQLGEQQGTTTSHPPKKQPSSADSNDHDYYFLEADQLVVVRDAHAETLRWMELSYQQQQARRQSSTGNYNNAKTASAVSAHHQRGYPCRSFQAEDLYYVILSDCQQTSTTTDGDNSSITTGAAGGVSVEDLAECLDLPVPHVEGMIEELQISGQIYRNPQGCYLPL